jgi:hypothetical protein
MLDNALTRLSRRWDSYGRAFSIFGEQWILFSTIASVAYVPHILLVITYGGDLLSIGESVNMWQEAAKTRLIMALIFKVLVGTIAHGAMALAVAEMYTGRLPSLKECVKKSFPRICHIFQAELLACLGFGVACIVAGIVYGTLYFWFGDTLGGFLVVAVPLSVAFIHLYTAISLVPSVVMIENLDPVQTIKRCWELNQIDLAYTSRTIVKVTMVNICFMLAITSPVDLVSPWVQVCTNSKFLFFFPYSAM